MSRFPEGREPKCPAQRPGCLGILKERTAKQCFNCYRYEKQQGTVTRKVESISGSENEVNIDRQTTERVRSLEQLIKVCEIDTDIWEVVEFTCNKWEMGYVDKKAGSAKQIPLYQVKARLRRKVVQIATRAEVDALIAKAKKGIKWTIPSRLKPSRSELSLLIEINDAHFGKLAWKPETGYAHYDLKIAKERYITALQKLIDRTMGYHFEEIIFPFGNDLINSDNPTGTTNSGTMQNNDGRYHKTFSIVRDLMIETISRLREAAPVRAIGVPGNHDKDTVWHLGDSLQCFFHNDKDIQIDNEPSMRKYHQFGRNMLMFLHGHQGKKNDYPLLMATERKEMWANTVNREIHTGHLHTERMNEIKGVKVFVSPALCPPDAWHSENQYVGNAEAAQAVIYHKDEGRIGTASYTIRESA